jgi:hypothetical protein
METQTALPFKNGKVKSGAPLSPPHTPPFSHPAQVVRSLSL